MIKREFTADYINMVANHPSVRGGTKVDTLDHPADFTEVVNDLNNILLSYDGGCFLLMGKPDYVFEVHTMALKEGRGKKLRAAVGEMLDYLFTFANCEKLESMAFTDNGAAVKLAEEFMTTDRTEDGINYYSLAKYQWATERAA